MIGVVEWIAPVRNCAWVAACFGIGRPMTALATGPSLDAADRVALHDRYGRVRDLTEDLAAPLSDEDQVVQSMPDVSPTKWHRAHTTWFFETFLLSPRARPATHRSIPRTRTSSTRTTRRSVRVIPRPQRGLLSRPSVDEIARYRAHVDDAMHDLIDDCDADAAALVVLGLHHEQQHQELLLMDIKHVLHCNPTDPVYARRDRTRRPPATPLSLRRPCTAATSRSVTTATGSASTTNGRATSCTSSRSRIADRLVSRGRVARVHRRRRLPPRPSSGSPTAGTRCRRTAGTRRSTGATTAPTAGASSRSAVGARSTRTNPSCTSATTRPTRSRAGATRACPPSSSGSTRSRAARPGTLREIDDVAWQWTASAYLPYPRFRPPAGAVGEYNGKFMSGQMTLRGGARDTPPGHTRVTYRNFFPPASRWMFGGVRLAART